MKPQQPSSLNHALDDIVSRTATWCEARSMHPFGICWGLAWVTTTALAALGSGSWRGSFAFGVTLLLYAQVFLPAKQRVLPGARRKLMIDFGLFVGPVFAGLGLALGVNGQALLGALSLAMPAGILVLRTGCFLGGCCHGMVSRWGPRYGVGAPRVVPLPLLEAGVSLLLLLAAAASMLGGARQPTLALCLLGAYASYRFAAEFFRARSGVYEVRRFGALSLTQWMCAALMSALLTQVVL